MTDLIPSASAPVHRDAIRRGLDPIAALNVVAAQELERMRLEREAPRPDAGLFHALPYAIPASLAIWAVIIGVCWWVAS